MHGPPVVGWLLVAVCCAAGAVCLARTRCLGAGPERRVALLETAMGFSMALMAVPGTPVPLPVFTAVFGGTGLVALYLWARGRATEGRRHRRHLPHHVVEAGEMAAMTLTASPSAGGHAGHGTSGAALPMALLACYFLACAVRYAVVLAPVAVPAGGPAPRLAALPETAHACRVALALAMAVMLLL